MDDPLEELKRYIMNDADTDSNSDIIVIYTYLLSKVNISNLYSANFLISDEITNRSIGRI
jgi:hypothetical protein